MQMSVSVWRHQLFSLPKNITKKLCAEFHTSTKLFLGKEPPEPTEQGLGGALHRFGHSKVEKNLTLPEIKP
jgi:hypothetical protein